MWLGACAFVLCLAPLYVYIGFFDVFWLSTGLGMLHCTVQLLLFWLVLLLLMLMGFLGAVLFAAPSLVRTLVSSVTLVDVAVQAWFPAVPVAVPPPMTLFRLWLHGFHSLSSLTLGLVLLIVS